MSENRHFAWVKAKDISFSSILPSRTHNPDLRESVKSVGIQQPLIVRPKKSCSGKYELIDGLGRLEPIDPEQEVYLDIRDNITDIDVFKISEATFQRKDRSAYEKAYFYAEWLKTLEKEEGKSEGLQVQLAKQTNLTESAISQYMAIYEMFEKLKSQAPTEEFNALKGWSVNKLYELSTISEDPDFLEAGRELQNKGDVSIEEIEHFLTERKVKKIEGILTSPDEEDPNSPEPGTGSASASLPALEGMRHTSYKNCLDYAQKVSKLETETHQTLSALIQKMVSNVDKFPPTSEILGILTTLLQTLRKLRKQANALDKKIKPPD